MFSRYAKRHLIGTGTFTFLAGVLLVQLQVVAAQEDPGIGSMQERAICLLQPIGGVRCIDPRANPMPLGVFEMYFSLFYPWLVGVCMGVALLNVVYAGIQIINDGTKSEGKERIRWSVIGLLILIFSSMILRMLNPTFFK